MKLNILAYAALLAGALGLSGCVYYSHSASQAVHDDELTFDDYDGTVYFEAGPDAEEAYPPIEVHEFDPGPVTAAGGARVIDGQTWLTASDYERNDLLNKVEKAKPGGTTLVIVVATGEVWQVPYDLDHPLPDGVRPWRGSDYDRLDEYVGERYAARHPMTLGKYLEITRVADGEGLGTVRFVHDFGATGVKEIEGSHGFQVVPSRLWLQETPQQRVLKLMALQDFYRQMPAFQGEGNRPAFGVSVPRGSVYVLPETDYRKLTGYGALKLWTPYEIATLPVVPTSSDRWIRNTPVTVDLKLKF